MAIKASGPLSFSEIINEFADSPPYSMSEFYRGGLKVPTNNTNIPLNGTIRFSNFYNAVNRVALSVVYSTNTQQATVNPITLPGYIPGVSDITITVNSGIYVWSNSTAIPALNITGGLAVGDTITLVNNGFIMGRGGNASGTLNAPPGNPGGPAMNILTPLRITNNSFIGGGGGGGSFAGGGGAGGGSGGPVLNNASPDGGAPGQVGQNGATNANGGGGGRIMPGVGGQGNQGGGAGGGGHRYSGNFGVSSPGGVGGSAGNPGGDDPANNQGGGGGGGWGAAGGRGRYYTFYFPSGGAGGKAINLNGFSITWLVNGTVYGAVS